jgi:hypothetical protein
MAANSALMRAVEQLGYRVTVGDVAAQAGLQVGLAQRELMSLAADVGANMQVAESGEIAYLFPRNFRDILRDKDFRIQLQETWAKIWAILFFLIRISFGIFLIASILLIVVAIVVLVVAGSLSQGSSSDHRDDDISGDLSGALGSLGWGFSPDFFWYLLPFQREPAVRHRPGQQINFLEAIFSFLFGDGNPNANLAKRGWQQLGALIRHYRGAVVAEQIVPYLTTLPDSATLRGTDESYVLPVLVQFNGVPQVSDTGQIIYQFPDLQTTAEASGKRPPALKPNLEEKVWPFSRASSTQVLWIAGLGVVNLLGALILGTLLAGAVGGGFIGFIRWIFVPLLAYAIGFLGIPAVRYWILLDRNQKIAERNFQRQQLASQLQTELANPEGKLTGKLNFARQFALQNYVDEADLAYTTEKDLIEQDIAQKAKIDAEWQRRLEQGDGTRE